MLDFDIKILFEDSELMAIDKPFGITVNKSATTFDVKTVQDWAEHKLNLKSDTFFENQDKDDESGLTADFISRAGIVHRLDKETSGILLIAKNKNAFSELQRQFKERLIKKTYLALVHGKVVPESGEINVPVGRLPWNRRSFGVVAGGRPAVTKYQTEKYYVLAKQKEILTLLKLYPETGRTHQIRVHLKYIGHPIFADFLYAGRKIQRNDRKILSRVFLHASEIVFIHPDSKKEIKLSSNLAADLQELLDNKLAPYG